MNIVSNRASVIEAQGRQLNSLRVKLIYANDLMIAESQLNHWLAANEISVSHIGQSQCERNGNLLFVISVFYNINSCI